MTSFRCEAVVRCASRNMEEICVRSSFSGVSSGVSRYGEEILDAVDAREFSVWTEDLWDTAAEVRDERAVETLPGILKASKGDVSYVASWVVVQGVMVVVVKSLRKLVVRFGLQTRRRVDPATPQSTIIRR